jgi:hypothetical protein
MYFPFAWAAGLVSEECLILTGEDLDRNIPIPIHRKRTSRASKPGDAAQDGQGSSPSEWIVQANQWIDDCIYCHADCTRANIRVLSTVEVGITLSSEPLSRLPKRLIDISQPDKIVIVDCADWVARSLGSIEELQVYCTLSYRWGEPPHVVLSELFRLTKDVPIASVPQTFIDAIKVTAGLRVRFLWIDALCIVQPPADGADLDEEGARMGIIYENALCNIAATSATHPDQGFLHDLGKGFYGAEPCVIGRDDTGDDLDAITLPVSAPTFEVAITHSQLNVRGWVFQERAMSKRILHFTVHGLFWECGVVKAHAGGAPAGMDSERAFRTCSSKERLLSMIKVRYTNHVCPVEWFHFIQNYSAAEFSHANNRLFALSSIARALLPFYSDSNYLAGLWKHDFVRGLGWYSRHARHENRLRADRLTTAPTWSWASSTGAVVFMDLVEIFKVPTFDLVEVVDVQIRHLNTNTFGSVAEGKIIVSGWLEKVAVPIGPNGWYRDYCSYAASNKCYMAAWDELPEPSEDSKGQKDEAGRGSPALSPLSELAEGEESALSSPVAIAKGDGSASSSSSDTADGEPSSLVTSKAYLCLPIARSDAGSGIFGALVLEPIGETRVGSSGLHESVRKEYRRIGWAQFGRWGMDRIYGTFTIY